MVSGLLEIKVLPINFKKLNVGVAIGKFIIKIERFTIRNKYRYCYY